MKTETISIKTTVGEIVRALPARACVFEILGIDYRGRGTLALGDACQSQGLEPARVIALLTATEDASLAAGFDPRPLGHSELCEIDNPQSVHKENKGSFPKALATEEEEPREPSSPVCYAKEFKDW